MGRRKYTIEEVRESFEKEGYTLLSEEYINSNTKLEFVCNNGHKHTMKFSKWLMGQRCIHCRVYHISDIKEAMEKEGYTLLSKQYIPKSNLHYICSNGHKSTTIWSRWLRGSRCAKCNFNSNIKDTTPTIEEIESEGYRVINKAGIINTAAKFDIVCNNGHIYTTCLQVWKAGHRCKICAYEKLSNKYRHNVETIREYMNSFGYTLLSNSYRNAFRKLDIRCDKGHIYSAKWNDFQQGYRCPTCATINNSGPNASNWKGGISFEPYCEAWKDKNYKESIKERDGYRCLNPYCRSVKKGDLTIHHVNYDKKDCAFINLITVCRSCNAKANYDREWHTSWYRAILRNRYNYIYKEKEYE